MYFVEKYLTRRIIEEEISLKTNPIKIHKLIEHREFLNIFF